MKKYDAKLIYRIMLELLKKIGISVEDSEIIAKCYIEADLAGVSTHGVNVFPEHLNKFINGVYNKVPKIKLQKQTSSFAVLDGDASAGPISGYNAMKLSVSKAGREGIYTTFINNTNTIGPAFFYNSIALKEKMIGITLTNSPAAMAPTNGKEKLLGTNPIAISIPALKENPIIYDIATSQVAKSKIKEALINNKKIPLDWALDENGKQTDEPKEAIKGLVLPMAGYKGYGLSMCIDVLTGVISGASFLNKVGKFYGNDSCMNIGATFIAINPKIVLNDEFYQKMDEYIKIIKNSQKISNEEILIPGENRIRNKEKAIIDGISINEDTIEKLKEYLKVYKINEKI